MTDALHHDTPAEHLAHLVADGKVIMPLTVDLRPAYLEGPATGVPLIPVDGMNLRLATDAERWDREADDAHATGDLRHAYNLRNRARSARHLLGIALAALAVDAVADQ